MLTLKLKNFRKFTSAEFIFDHRLSLISGKSGQGKTTIFMAIMFALNGEGKKLPTYGKTSCSVTLKMTFQNDEITIIRTKRPNILKVTMGSSTKEDNIAQAEIDRLFPNYHMGYMAQRTDKIQSFILMTPTDKTRYIEKMVFGGENVNMLMVNCKELIKERKNELMLVTRERETIEKMLKDLNIKKINGVMKERLSDEEYSSQIEHFERTGVSLKNKLMKTENLLKIREDVTKQLSQIPLIDDEIEKIEYELNRIFSHKEQWVKYQQEYNKLKKLNEPVLEMDEIEKIISDMKKIIRLEEETINIESLKNKITVYNKQITDSTVHMTCPACHMDVAMWCNKLIIPSIKGSNNNKILTLDESKRLEQKLTCAKIHLDELEQKVLESDKIRIEYPGLKDARSKLSNILKVKSNNEAYMTKKLLCSSIKVSCPDYDDEEDILRKKKKYIYERKEKESVLSNLVIKYDPTDLKEQINLTINSISNLTSDKKISQSITYWEKVSNLIEAESNLNRSYPRAIKLQEIIKTAETLAMMQMIDEINLHAQLYMDYFFDDLNVMLVFDGVKLNSVVIQNGHDSDLQNLSGGELARVILAFTIALAEINNVQLLMLDECVASLDQESTAHVIDTIKTNYKGFILCIAHQTTTGVFDHVLEL
jgi:exonuclease SbcC